MKYDDLMEISASLNNYESPAESKIPAEGKPYIVKGANYTAVAFYCDGEFYTLKYDPYLGVLRKSHVDKPLYWTEIRGDI